MSCLCMIQFKLDQPSLLSKQTLEILTKQNDREGKV